MRTTTYVAVIHGRCHCAPVNPHTLPGYGFDLHFEQRLRVGKTFLMSEACHAVGDKRPVEVCSSFDDWFVYAAAVGVKSWLADIFDGLHGIASRQPTHRQR